jgi:hypothetical protein
MSAARDFFAADYAEARRKFLEAAGAAGLTAEHHVNPERGMAGEELATDVVRIGPEDAARVLITMSATHGVEGFCGSGAQVGTLTSGAWRELPDDTALVMIHAINPYGFSWLRRVNEDNVDLNRNHVDHDQPYPENPGYAALRDAICPASWTEEARAAADEMLEAYREKHGDMALRSAISRGQYVHPEGIFFGGHFPVLSRRVLHDIVARHAGQARHLGFIDYHTGLGPYGYGEPISDHTLDEPGHARLIDWIGDDVTSTDDGSSTSAPLTGVNADTIKAAAPKTSHTIVTLEYGTQSMPEVVGSLRADCWLHAHGELDSDLGRAIKAEIRRCFYGDDDTWKESVWQRADDTQRRMLKGLAALG